MADIDSGSCRSFVVGTIIVFLGGFVENFFLLLTLILLTVSGCSNANTGSSEWRIVHMQSGMGSINDTASNDKQKFSYDITISGKEATEIQMETMEIVLTDWIKHRQLKSEITNLTFDSESFMVKGCVNFDTKGLSKKEIAEQLPFIKGVYLVTETGDEIFIRT